jgi:hypothetical protein
MDLAELHMCKTNFTYLQPFFSRPYLEFLNRHNILPNQFTHLIIDDKNKEWKNKSMNEKYKIFTNYFKYLKYLPLNY